MTRPLILFLILCALAMFLPTPMEDSTTIKTPDQQENDRLCIMAAWPERLGEAEKMQRAITEEKERKWAMRATREAMK